MTATALKKDTANGQSTYFASYYHSPLGYIGARCDEAGLYAIDWQQAPLAYDFLENDVSRETIRQIKAYLAGELQRFSLPLSPHAVSPSLRRWLDAMVSVPYGETVSYAALAALWGNGKAARAAGSACQRNPLPIIIPCHRIIGSDGSYDKYSGGDITAPSSAGNVARKKALLDLEAGLCTIS